MHLSSPLDYFGRLHIVSQAACCFAYTYTVQTWLQGCKWGSSTSYTYGKGSCDGLGGKHSFRHSHVAYNLLRWPLGCVLLSGYRVPSARVMMRIQPQSSQQKTGASAAAIKELGGQLQRMHHQAMVKGHQQVLAVWPCAVVLLAMTLMQQVGAQPLLEAWLMH